MAPRVRIGDLVPVDVEGFRGGVHVREDGPADAPPLVMLHGFGGSLHWFDRVVPLLAGEHRLIRVDLAGHGSTGGRAADAPVQGRIVEAVLAAGGVEGATALGHSFGADVAVELAERSDRVERLVIVTQAPDYSDATLPRGSGLMTIPLLGLALGHTFRQLARVAGPLLIRRAPVTAQVLAAQALADIRALDIAMFRIVLAVRRDRMARRPLDEQVRTAGKPTLVILGELDHFYGARSARRYEAAGATVRILPESGHSPLVDLPDESAALIHEFLAGQSRNGRRSR